MSTKKSTLFILISLATLVVGYLLGASLGWPIFQEDAISGDIGKARRHKGDTGTTELSLMEQRLKTDTTYFTQTISLLTYISVRINEFKTYSEFTAKEIAGTPALQKYVEPMQSLTLLSDNGSKAATAALTALMQLNRGEEGVSVETLSSNAGLAYLMLERGISISRDFVTDVDAFLKGKKVTNYLKLALARDYWADYNLVEAVLHNDRTLVDYWVEKGLLTNQEQQATVDPSYAESLALAGVANSSILAHSELINDRLALMIWNRPALGGMLSLSEDQLRITAVTIGNAGELNLVNNTEKMGLMLCSENEISLMLGEGFNLVNLSGSSALGFLMGSDQIQLMGL